MKNTFSAYVRLSQTRTRETIQAVLSRFAGTAKQAEPGQGVWRYTKPPFGNGERAVV
jgi:hypothetical protein